ncbi:globin domain-containing protein [Kitasatospora sp. MMS16-BH015]|uniref:globin domain-containing protein n=1 Tax=Kitasatospora sp. MMS16-BH015 TaxID=2018025 RepID=UPI0020C3E6D4|nr:globin domain-containing protein [Kitasatospora sp. MMS16-BH015]
MIEPEDEAPEAVEPGAGAARVEVAEAENPALAAELVVPPRPELPPVAHLRSVLHVQSVAQVMPMVPVVPVVQPVVALSQSAEPVGGVVERVAPGAQVPPAAPVQPMFPDAPGLNWAGPGDHWSRAWALGTVGETEVTPPAAPEPVAAVVEGGAPTARDIELIRASLAVVEPVADRATAHFYALIFLHHPEVRALFPAAMDVQRDRLFRALLAAARGADDLPALTEYLSALGRGHRKYGTLTGHYGPVGECLIAALERYCGSRWDAETELAWRRVYGLIAKVMSEAAEEAARVSPPWWQAEIVGHRLRTPEVVELTLRPDQAYPYRAGQHASVETPWWPRVWRQFSFATAPRPDGLLTFQVKAVPAGWVSNALVHRAAPGDVLRIGPAAGAMVVDHAGGEDLLCLGGGTGIAPIRALVEEVAEHGAGGRAVDVFYGARRRADLYELAELRRLATVHRWLSVRAMVSAEPVVTGEALVGELPEVIGGPGGAWRGRAAYLSGPAAMVRRAAGALLRAGVAPTAIHHDLVGELA